MNTVQTSGRPQHCFVSGCKAHPDWHRPAPSPRPVYAAGLRARVTS